MNDVAVEYIELGAPPRPPPWTGLVDSFYGPAEIEGTDDDAEDCAIRLARRRTRLGCSDSLDGLEDDRRKWLGSAARRARNRARRLGGSKVSFEDEVRASATASRRAVAPSPEFEAAHEAIDAAASQEQGRRSGTGSGARTIARSPPTGSPGRRPADGGLRAASAELVGLPEGEARRLRLRLGQP